ncbi:MAG: LLM class flavin-dependent oxidoreductase [Steroidobacteraceae bacterium]|jgi:alkanesulfonate monooxygenase SsuD/methylene tetrahydromethanopterin reductase-like flavin-dependent oxidoreductase (luciferase family)|nr:LLM class flavin-dependent oxidoreductase [Steroidobacteraceae bacterium]
MKVDVILEAGLPEARVEALAVAAEGYGIQTLWVSSFPSRRDPVPALALAARATRRIRLATLPTSPYEVHPLRIADQLLTLNELSQGRATILIGGLGHSVSRVTGLQPTRRVTAVREAVSILKGLRADAPLDFRGELYSLLDYRAEWATAPSPRVYAGATFEKMARMAAQVADGTMLSDAPLGRMPEVMGWIRAGLEASGRRREDFRINNFMAWHVKRDRAASIAEARREMVWRGFLLPWFTEPFLGPETARFVEARKPAFLKAFFARTPQVEGVPEPVMEQLVRHLTLAGDLAEIERIAEDLHALGAAGLDEVALRLHDQPEEGLRLIGEHLLPALGLRPRD